MLARRGARDLGQANTASIMQLHAVLRLPGCCGKACFSFLQHSSLPKPLLTGEDQLTVSQKNDAWLHAAVW